MKRKLLQNLINWKSKSDRKPLIIRGARQVGKTYLVKEFGTEYYENLIYINLDNSQQLDLFGTKKTLEELLSVIDLYFGVNPNEGENLIFIDEIQNSPELIQLLRFFYEEKPELHVICAGSLLEAKIRQKNISMPVGRVEYMYTYPMDFYEYLAAVGHSKLLKNLMTIEINLEQPKDIFDKLIPDHLHKLAMDHFNDYMLIGGMPEIVKSYAQTKSWTDLRPIYNSLFQTYLEDIEKYSKDDQRKYISHVLNSAPLHAGGIYNYQNFGASNYRSREMSEAFDLLDSVRLLNQITATDSTKPPLREHIQRSKKLVFLDVGLVNFRSGNSLDLFQNLSQSDEFRGRIAEQIVGQTIVSQHSQITPYLHYWAKNKAISETEVDFCFTSPKLGGRIVGIEVKSGATGIMKSLYNFLDDVPDAIALRIYTGMPRLEEVNYAGKEYRFHSVPVYLLPKLVKELL